MHLINVKTRQLETFYGSTRPRYAILSHTWGAQEVSHQDYKKYSKPPPFLRRVPSKQRAGHAKIEGTCRRAAQNGIPYVWVDTCCVDKSSSAELQEFINSMFEWYENAAICYAYLSDVAPVVATSEGDDGLSAFRSSQWFLRGWTLPELLAPREVCFLDQRWTLLGNKMGSLGLVVQDITGIELGFLQRPLSQDAYGNLSKASIAKRMSWAATRNTTRIEDMTYCMLGLFAVKMPMLYGEGWAAFPRLQDEIMKTSCDGSLFAWGFNSSYHRDIFLESSAGCLPSRPENFRNCGTVEDLSESDGGCAGFRMTQRGLEITLQLRSDPNHRNLCHGVVARVKRGSSRPQSSDGTGADYDLIVVPLLHAALSEDGARFGQHYMRSTRAIPVRVSSDFLKGCIVKTALIWRDGELPGPPLFSRALEVRSLTPDYSIIGHYPPFQLPPLSPNQDIVKGQLCTYFTRTSGDSWVLAWDYELTYSKASKLWLITSLRICIEEMAGEDCLERCQELTESMAPELLDAELRTIAIGDTYELGDGNPLRVLKNHSSDCWNGVSVNVTMREPLGTTAIAPPTSNAPPMVPSQA